MGEGLTVLIKANLDSTKPLLLDSSSINELGFISSILSPILTWALEIIPINKKIEVFKIH